MRLTVRRKVLGLLIAPPVLCGLFIAPIAAISWQRMHRRVDADLDASMRTHLAQVADDVGRLCSAVNENGMKQLETAMRVAERLVGERGGLVPGRKAVRWTATSQVDGRTVEVELPEMTLGGTWFGQETSFRHRVPLVDDVRELTAGTCTVFQRMNPGGDMLRVATSVPRADGSRGTGTFVPASGADGAPNPIVATVLRGETFRGRAFVVDQWYVTHYKPLTDAGGRVTGMLYVGIPQRELAGLHDAITKIKLGKSGYVYVLGASGKDKGRYIISKDGKRDGENIWEMKDADGRLFIQDIIREANEHRDGSIAFVSYPWQNTGEPRRQKIVAIKYFKDWDWVIGAGMANEEAAATAAAVNGAVGGMALTSALVTALVLAVVFAFGVVFVGRITRPLDAMAHAAQRLAHGDIRQSIAHRSDDEVGELAEAFRGMITTIQEKAEAAERIAAGDLSGTVPVASPEDVLGHSMAAMQESVKALAGDVGRLIGAATEGQLSVRADADRHRGEFAGIVMGINATLDAVTGPLRVAADYVDRIAKGDIPPRIEDHYNGDFAALRDNLNTCIDAVNRLVADARGLSAAAVRGQLATRADASRHQGDFRAIVQGVNDTLDAVIAPLNVAAETVDRIAKGDIPERLAGHWAGDFETLHTNLNTCIDAVNALIADARSLASAAVEGRLSARADVTRHEGDFRRIVQGVNDTLDAVIGPLNAAAETVDRIAKGDIPAPLAGHWAGDFETLHTNLNTCIAAVNALVADANGLSAAAVRGALSTRADAARHQGDFRRIVQGVNDTLDAVIGPLNVAAETVDRIAKGDIPPRITGEYRGDFAALRDNLNTCIDAVNALVEDARALSTAAVAGRLSTRADAGRHQGDFRAIVQGVNATLDAVIGPLNVAAETVDRIAKGDIPPRIGGEYRGDFAALRDNLDTCGDAVRALVSDVVQLAEGAVAGDLAVRADVMRHAGDFRRIVEGINATLAALTGPVVEASGALSRIAARDLTARVDGHYQGDHARIKDALNTAVVNLDESLQTVATVADQVATAASQISINSQTLARGSSEQAAVLEEISASLQEMSSMTRQNSESAGQARTMAEETLGSVEGGLASMRSLSDAIGRIKDSSDQTARIVKTIDEIAFQTNLLALNAAVEAARAGDAGKGFAVVAEEVRNLALRSAEAARQTSALIEAALSNAESGVEANDRVAASLATINAQARRVSEVMSEIALASTQQTEGIAQLSKAIEQFNGTTQESAASSEEAASVSEELAAQAAEARSLVQTFQLSR